MVHPALITAAVTLSRVLLVGGAFTMLVVFIRRR